ncbi:MAG: outer membrane protein assembly factor BamD, partial [Verrucomicrobiales bacterium]
MKIQRSTVLCVVATLATLAAASPSQAVLGFFEKEPKKAPSASELESQEGKAQALFQEAVAREKKGKPGKTVSAYNKIVEKYPLTASGARSQFKIGELLEAENKGSKAFDAYQKFIENYKGSSLFMVAVKRQYQIASASLDGDKQDRFLGMRVKVQPSRLIEMFTSIQANAPFSEYAPLSQYNIGKIREDQKQVTEAVLAYEKVVEDYPRHPKAAEAQYQIGSMLTNASIKGNNDQGHLQQTREAYEELLIQFPESQLASEAKTELTEIQAQEISKSYNIAEFYEKKRNYRAAAIYYEEVARHPDAKEYADAKERIALMDAKDIEASVERASKGEAPATASNEPAKAPKTVPAAVDVKGRDDYLGPPAPDLGPKVAQRRSMRSAMEDLGPLPVVEEPDLPQASPPRETAAAPSSLTLPPSQASSPPLPETSAPSTANPAAREP